MEIISQKPPGSGCDGMCWAICGIFCVWAPMTMTVEGAISWMSLAGNSV